MTPPTLSHTHKHTPVFFNPAWLDLWFRLGLLCVSIPTSPFHPQLLISHLHTVAPPIFLSSGAFYRQGDVCMVELLSLNSHSPKWGGKMQTRTHITQAEVFRITTPWPLYSHMHSLIPARQILGFSSRPYKGSHPARSPRVNEINMFCREGDSRGRLSHWTPYLSARRRTIPYADIPAQRCTWMQHRFVCLPLLLGVQFLHLHYGENAPDAVLMPAPYRVSRSVTCLRIYARETFLPFFFFLSGGSLRLNWRYPHLAMRESVF